MSMADGVKNLATGKRYKVSTVRNPFGVWETAVFELGFLGIPKLHDPALVLNAPTIEQARVQHRQCVDAFTHRQPAEVEREYLGVGSLGDGQLLVAEQDSPEGGRRKAGAPSAQDMSAGPARLLGTMEYGAGLVVKGVCCRLHARFLDRCGQDHAVMLAAAVTNTLFSQRPTVPHARAFAEAHAAEIEAEIGRLRADSEIRDAVTRAVVVLAMVAHGRGMAVDDARRPVAELLSRGMCAEEALEPTPETFLPFAQAFMESSPGPRKG
jgi:hypothetical protein